MPRLALVGPAVVTLLVAIVTISQQSGPTPHASTEVFRILEKDLIPEGIAHDPVTSTYFVGSTYKRKILSLDRAGSVREFSAPSDGLWGVVGMKVDPKRRHLWACSASTSEMPMVGFDPREEWRSGVWKYDLETGKLLKRYIAEGSPHFLNDLAVSANGDVFVTDTASGEIFRIPQEGNALEVFLKTDEIAYPNGIAFSSDDARLYVAHESGLSIVDPKTREHAAVAHPDVVNLTGIDGLCFQDGGLVAVQNGVQPPQVVRFILSADGRRVTSARVLDSDHPTFQAPTTGVVVRDSFTYIANSQINSFRDGRILPMDQLSDVIILNVKL